MNKLLKGVFIVGISMTVCFPSMHVEAAEVYHKNAYYEEGDLDGNHIVNLQDAKLAICIYLSVDKAGETQKWLADVNHNEKVDLGDAKEVLRRYLKVTKQTSNQTKNVVIQGNMYQVRLDTVGQENDIYFGEQIRICYDHEMGRLTGIDLTDDKLNEKNVISTDDAVSVAKKFLEPAYDFSEYTLHSVYYDEFSGYSLSYIKEPKDNSTGSIIFIDMYADGTIHFMDCNRYVSGSLSLDGIDDVANMQDIKNILSSGNNLLKYRIRRKSLGVKDGKFIITYAVECDFEEYTSIERFQYEID